MSCLHPCMPPLCLTLRPRRNVCYASVKSFSPIKEKKHCRIGFVKWKRKKKDGGSPCPESPGHVTVSSLGYNLHHKLPLLHIQAQLCKHITMISILRWILSRVLCGRGLEPGSGCSKQLQVCWGNEPQSLETKLFKVWVLRIYETCDNKTVTEPVWITVLLHGMTSRFPGYFSLDLIFLPF